MKEFGSKVAIVTGSTGIGRGTAKRLAADGASVVVCGIDAAANRALQKESDDSGLALRVELCDVSRPEQVQEAVAKTVRQFGGLDLIVNSAAIHPFGTAVETDPETWNRCMAVNLGSAYLLAHFGVPEMKKRGGGSIVIVARGCRLCRFEGRSSQLDARSRAGPRERSHSRQFHQPGIHSHAHAGTLSRSFFAERAGREGVGKVRRGTSARPGWHGRRGR
jgi:NAD(P)-dependent dehydrogenase (short-subunit alcohol dehydrogenase family)